MDASIEAVNNKWYKTFNERTRTRMSATTAMNFRSEREMMREVKTNTLWHIKTEV